MNKTLKIIIAIFLVCILIVGLCLGLFLLKPQLGIKKNREKLTVSNADSLERDDCVHFLSTGSSDCILIESNGHFGLVDCAEDNDNPRGFEDLELQGFEDVVLAYLKENAADKNGKIHLDFVLGTHAHSDHIGGFDTIISDESVSVSKAYLREYDESKISEYEVENWDNKEVYDQMVNALKEKNIPIDSSFDETQFTLGDFNITLFNTEPQNDTEPVGENDNAIGVLVEKSGRKIFLAADIDNKSGDEDRLAPQIGKIDVLKVGHHSYSGSTTTNWLETLRPEVCVVTNNFESTDKRTLRRITRVLSSPILVTGQENGVIVSVSDSGEISYYNNNCK